MASTSEAKATSGSNEQVPGGCPPSGTDAPAVESPANVSPLFNALRARKSEYVRQRSIQIKVASWNVAARPGTERDVREWFAKGKGVVERLAAVEVSEGQEQSTTTPAASPRENPSPEKPNDSNEENYEITVPFPAASEDDTDPEGIGIYVLGLQEIVDISSPTETLKPYYDPGPVNKWKKAIEDALPGFQLVADPQLVGLLLLIYAAPSVAPNISSVSSTSVATGLLGYVGNKGGVMTRLVLGQSTSLIFINCHLAAGADKGSLERRNWDAAQIVSRMRFEPVNTEHNLIDQPIDTLGEEDLAFWLGDLNYRLDHIPASDVRNVLHRHTLNKYDGTTNELQGTEGGNEEESATSLSRSTVESAGASERDDEAEDEPNASDIPSSVSDEEVDPLTDPNSLETTIASLFPHDQLRILQKEGKAFHDGWREGDIGFLPTYKYDIGRVAVFDSSEKLRGPSWCDRILYRTRQDRIEYEQRVNEASEVARRDEEMKKRGLDREAADDAVLFDYDPATDGADNDQDGYRQEEDEAGGADNNNASGDASTSPLPPNDTIQLVYYKSCQGILTSDHKPLEALFTLTYDSVVPELKAKVHQDVARDLDKVENESRPALTVVVDEPSSSSDSDENTVDFGEVAYDVPVTRTLTVANTSGVPATFCFAETPSLTKEALQATIPPWLHIQIERKADTTDEEEEKKRGRMDDSPAGEHRLFPGDVGVINATAHVKDIHHVRALNDGEMKLEEILVLRVNDGRDHFLSVMGKWLSTCFGRSVDDLTHIPEAGARSLEPTAEAWRQQKEGEGARLSAPREIFRLTESVSELAERAVAEWSMTKSGSDEELSPPWTGDPHGTKWPFARETWTLQDRAARAALLARARQALDTNETLTTIFPPELSSLRRVEILAEVLLDFLHSLSDGIVTACVWQNMEQELIAREKAKARARSWEETQAWVLEKLAYSPAHSVSFTFVTFMLARIANEVAPVQLTAPQQPPPTQLASSSPASSSFLPSLPSTASSLKKSARQSWILPQLTTKKNNDHQQQQDEEEATPSPAPSPASMAAFISAGSFHRHAPSGGGGIGILDSSVALKRRHNVESSLATVFSYYLISSDVPIAHKEKERRVTEARKRSVIEPFLRTLGVG